jgi:hypothetical protein
MESGGEPRITPKGLLDLVGDPGELLRACRSAN